MILHPLPTTVLADRFKESGFNLLNHGIPHWNPLGPSAILILFYFLTVDYFKEDVKDNLSLKTARLLMFLKFLLCGWCQGLWHKNLYHRIFVALNRLIFHRHDSLAFETDFRSGLRSRLNLTGHIAIKRVYTGFSAECRRCKRNHH